MSEPAKDAPSDLELLKSDIHKLRSRDLELLKSDLRKLRYDLEEFIVEYRLDHEPHSPLGLDQLTTLQKLEIFSGVILLFAGLATRDLGRIIAGLGLLTIAFYFKNDPWRG